MDKHGQWGKLWFLASELSREDVKIVITGVTDKVLLETSDGIAVRLKWDPASKQWEPLEGSKVW